MKRIGAAALAVLGPSVVAALIGSAIAGLAEGIVSTTSVVEALAAAGFVVVFLAPICLASLLAARGLWWAWNAGAVIDACVEDHGGAPLLAGWLAYALGAVATTGVAAFVTVEVVRALAGTDVVVSLGVAVIAALVAAVLVALSRPVVRVLAAALRAVDRRVHARIGRSALTPTMVLAGWTGSVIATAALAWSLGIEPRIGYLELGFVGYLAAAAAAAAVVHLGWPRIARRRAAARALGAVAVVVAATVCTAALIVRHARPDSLLAVWGDTQIAGHAIDALFDVPALRDVMELENVRPVARPGAVHPDVVLITIDTLRADYTPPYGGPAVMPNLVRLARQGAVFEWAFSPSNNTRRSLPTILLGQSPRRVRGRVVGWALRLDPRHIPVAERFRAAGYDTASFLCCGAFFAPERHLGMNRGVENVERLPTDEQVAKAGARWLAARDASGAGAPTFMWLHLMQSHHWYQYFPLADHDGSPSKSYIAALAEADRVLGVVMATIWARPASRPTLVVVTSDHGEGLGHKDQRFHSSNLYNSQIHVPLIVAGPGVEPARIPSPVGLVDLAPTLLDLAGFGPPGMPEMDGVSLGPILGGERSLGADWAAYATMVRDRSVHRSSRALVVGRHKYIEWSDAPPELYDYVADPKETKNLAKDEPAIFATMRRRMAEQRRVESIPPF